MYNEANLSTAPPRYNIFSTVRIHSIDGSSPNIAPSFLLWSFYFAVSYRHVCVFKNGPQYPLALKIVLVNLWLGIV